jgi:DNA ligase-4
VKSKCIVLGEMVLYSDKEKRILPFSKIRKHITRSGTLIGTWQDSLPHEWEHLMIVFFDVLVLDNEPVLRRCLQDRRKVLRDLVSVIPGRSMRSEWTLLDFKPGDGVTDLKQTFARNVAARQEGLVLKPLLAPYFPLLTEQGHRQASFTIKLKKDYLGDMGGERDLGDFAVIGASFDAQVAPKSDLKPLHWTHFHLGCCTNKRAVGRTNAKPKFKIVATLSLDKCIPKPDVKYLNI